MLECDHGGALLLRFDLRKTASLNLSNRFTLDDARAQGAGYANDSASAAA
jgi:hypothetical protein